MIVTVAIGQRFTRSTVVAPTMRKGRMAADCLCDCGKSYSTRPSNLAKGISHGCRSCALKGKAGRHFMERREKALRRHERIYRFNAWKRGYCWEIDTSKFRDLIAGSCHYCGITPGKGIDRRINAVGYTVENSVACCKYCNLAKRDRFELEFLLWVARIAAKQGFSL